MSKFSIFLALLVSCVSTHGLGAIWDDDNRVDVAAAPQSVQSLASATALMVSPVFISPNPGSSSVTLDFEQYEGGSAYMMCPEVKFAKQPANPVTCTGFLVGEDLLMTAGHCMINTGSIFNGTTPFCTDFVWIFDYKKPLGGKTDLSSVPQDRIYRCAEILYASNDTKVDPISDRYIYNEDFALIRLDRKVSGDRPKFSLSQRPVQIGDSLSGIGYPTGLPVKYSNRARVLDKPTPHYFRSNIDMLMGNSGSPILDKNQTVVGIEVRGYPEDFVWDSQRSCRTLNHCSDKTKSCQINDLKEGHGEHHYPATNILEKFKKLGIQI